MFIATRLCLPTLCCVISLQMFAQSVTITTQTPNPLYVCGQDAFEVTIKNTTTAPLTNLKVTVSLPTGIEYVPGSVGGATEFNLTNSGAPVFALADLPAGATAILNGQEKATCSVIAAINIGQLFNNIINVTYTGGNQQITSLNYPVETGLVFIVGVNPVAQNGLNGQVLTRTITVSNTRQGPVSSLQFSDQHFPGLSIQLAGIGGTNSTPILFEATVPGSYFTSFGDGDNLLEFNETVTFTEQITVEYCGAASFSNPSTIQIGWGCGDEICQSDVVTAEITVLPAAGENATLKFVPLYAPPISECAGEAATQELLIINTGAIAAQDLLLILLANDTARLGMDYNSIAYQVGTTWVPLLPVSGTQQALPACGVTSYYSKINVGLFPVPPGDTVRVRFDTYFCQPSCEKEEVGVTGLYFYQSACPTANAQNGYISFAPDTLQSVLESKIYFDIGDCIANNSVHAFDYWVKSKRLLHSTGYIRLEMELPWGLFWQNDCDLTLGGKVASLVKVDTVLNVSTTLHLAFQLPMSQDSVGGLLCLLNICQEPVTYSPAIPEPPPSGASYTVYPVAPPCSPCIQKIKATTSIGTTPDVATSCGISVCDGYELVLDCGCGDPGCVGNPSIGPLIVAEYDAWRTNVGLRDDNDDRIADNTSPANPALIRRDRFLPGDTMRTQLRGVIAEGAIGGVSFRIFNEAWQSDFGLDDGDSFQLPEGQSLFTNEDSLRYIGGSVVLKITATGETYMCPVASALRVDENHIKIAIPNVRPQEPYDQLITMFHQFNISLSDLADAGCIPAGLALQVGDSLIFRGDFVFRQNFTPNAANVPPLINFRNTICGPRQPFAWQLPGCFPPLMRQYSGYVESIRPPVYSILPCSTSTEIFPFRYTMRIARENLFPNEVRPLAWLSNYSHTLPNVDLLETRLKFLRLQENMEVFGSQLLPVTQLNNELYLDLNPLFVSPLDEGFRLEIGSIFAPSCAFTGTLKTLTRVQVRYPNAAFHQPVLKEVELPNLNGYNSAAPKLALVPEDSVIEVSTEQLELDFLLRNLTAAASPNTWLTVSSTSNGLNDAEIVLLPSGQAVPLVGGVFQLGSVLEFGQQQLRLNGVLNICEPITVTFTYGWDCDPVTNLANQPCRTYTKTVRLVPQSPELELVVLEQPLAVPMCAPSEPFVFEIYNAAKGRAYQPVGSVKLPPGLTVMAGSSYLSSPSGATWVPLSEPTLSTGNVYEWSPALPNGLLPFAQSPQNGFRIRFQVIAACGFVANSQPIYGADCRKPCGLASNKLRKPDLPIQLEGVEPTYTVDANLALADPNGATACGETTQLSAALSLNGTPTAGDSLYLILPAGVSYVAGSYQPGPNAPAGPPQVTGQGLQLPLPPNAVGSEVRFTISVRYDQAAGCSDQSVLLQVRQKAQAFCALTNQSCAVYVSTGEAILFLKTGNAELILQDFAAMAANNGLTYTAVLRNAGTGAAKNPVVQFFLDQNHNGQKDANEPLVGSQQTNGLLAPNTLLVIGGSLQMTAAQLCDLAALVPADANCACTDRVVDLGGQAIIQQAIGLCGLAAVPLQVDSLAGSTYTWLTTQGLACPTCTQTTYTPPANVQSGDLVTLVLVEKTGNCSIQHQFDLQFGGTLGIATQEQSICRGESVELHATPGGTYVWSGPGLTNPTLATQVVQPMQNANYTVTVTFAGGCTGEGQVAVTVLSRDSVNLGVRTTCVGRPIEIFGQLTETPGIYTKTLPKANGCDSTLLLRLALVPNETTEVRPLCAGDSTMVFDSLFYQAGSLCKTFSSTLGCDSTHCVRVMPVANPIIPAQDSVIIAIGQEVVLQGPGGFAEYVWLPSTGLSCSTCAEPVAKPDSTTNYLLVVANQNGCAASVLYRVLVFPPCDPQRLLIPNAFTPNGDQVNDTFSVVPFEGLESIQELTIYDRWGEKVYTGSGRTAAWDGTIAGKPAPPDVYVWRLVVNCNGERTPITMDVTLLR